MMALYRWQYRKMPPCGGKSRDKHCHKGIQREITRQELDTNVKDAFDNSKVRDGLRRIPKELAENDDSHNVKTIEVSMKRQDLTPKAARKFKCTMD